MSTIYIREQGQLVPLDIPEYKGDRGETGITPDLQVGSVTVLPSDQQASVTIQGDKENPTIYFEIPSGTTGNKGLYVGRPEDAYDETKVVFDDENWIDDTYFENSTVDYMGGEHKSLKEKSDSDVEYILRKFGTQHYEGQHITATNTYAMQVKSAMFKGQTLVNLVDDPKNTKGTWFIFNGDVDENGVWYFQSNVALVRYAQQKIPVKHNTTYTAFLRCKNKNTNNANNAYIGLYLESIDGGSRIYTAHENVLSDDYVLLKCKITTTTHNSVNFRLHARGLVGEVWFKDCMFIEGDYTKQDIPYFESMASVKSPMLTVTNADSTQSHTLTTPSDLELRSNGNVYDELDLITGKLTQRIGEDGNVLTQPIVKTIDLQNQKIYSYDGTTHYITSSLQGHPNPILSIDVPTNITSLLKHQQNTINQQRLILSEREEMQNILIESMLYRYEQSTLLNDTIEVVPDYIQKLYEVAYQRGIRFRKEE